MDRRARLAQSLERLFLWRRRDRLSDDVGRVPLGIRGGDSNDDADGTASDWIGRGHPIPQSHPGSHRDGGHPCRGARVARIVERDGTYLVGSHSFVEATP